MDDKTIFTVDVEQILREKAGAKARRVPRFVLSWLKKIVHQDEVNQFLEQSSRLSGVEWLEACVGYLDMKLDVTGKENLPAPGDGRHYTFVSNHPLGGIDGVALGAILGRHYDGHIRYLVNDLLMNLRGLAPLCIPINKTGSQSRDFPAMVEAGFQGEEWKKTFIVKSVQHQRDVVPIHFGGQNSNFFYALANFCKRTGIKFNVAMLFLVDEMYKNTHKRFSVKIGKPIPWQTFDKSRTPAQWAAWVQQQVYEL